MNGERAYADKINKRIDKIIEAHPEIPCLKGYRYYISSMAPASVYQYMGLVKNFMKFTGKSPEELRLDDYTTFLGKLKTESRTSSYQINAYTSLKKLSKYFKANQINDLDPMQYYDRPKPTESIETQTKRENNFLTKKEIKKMMDNVEFGIGDIWDIMRQDKTRERDMAIIMILLNTGMRCSALTKLDLSNINDHIIRVIEKGSKIIDYPLGEETWEALQAWIAKRNQMENKDPDALFVNQRGGRLSQTSIANITKKYSANIKGKKISPHKLRATYGSQVYEATKDVYFVQKAMHHSNPKTTEIYIRGQEDETKKASDIMSKLLK